MQYSVHYRCLTARVLVLSPASVTGGRGRTKDSLTALTDGQECGEGRLLLPATAHAQTA